MSYCGSISDVKAAIASIEESENTRTSTGGSPIKSGSSGPGGASSKAKPAGETMQQKRTTLHTATDSLKRRG